MANSKSDGSEPLERKVVCLSAGTAAVHLALIACGVQAGDEVLVQSFTFCASSHPITYLGAKPVFVGSEAETWNLDPVLLEKAIIDRKEKTGRYPKAIVPVALYGMPYQIDKIKLMKVYIEQIVHNQVEQFYEEALLKHDALDKLTVVKKKISILTYEYGLDGYTLFEDFMLPVWNEEFGFL